MAAVNPVVELVRLFGGVKPTLAALRQKYASIISEWKRRGSIPRYREHQIRTAAKARRIRLPRDLMVALLRPPVVPARRRRLGGKWSHRGRGEMR